MNLLFASIVIFAQVSGTSLADTLRAVEEGSDVTVSREVGAQAARALARPGSLSPEQVQLHLQVVLKAGAQRELAAVCPQLLADDGSALEPTLRVLGELEPKVRKVLLARVPAAVMTRFQVLDLWAADDDAVARGAILVAVPACAPRAAADVLRRVAAERPGRVTWVVEALSVAPPSQELLEALVEAGRDLPSAMASSLGTALASCADRQPALAPALVEALGREPSHALLGAVGAIPPEQHERAAETVMGLVNALSADPTDLTRPEVELLVSAIRAAGELRLPALLLELPTLCQPRMPMPVRESALRALGAVGAREAGTIDLLIGHLSEPEPLATAAYEGLIRRSGARMPQRPSAWQEWRARTKLTEMTPEEHAARLRAEQQALYDARRLAVKRAMRD